MKNSGALKKLLVIVAVSAASFVSIQDTMNVVAAGTSITGKVFEDKISNGVMDGLDTGISGVSVTAFDSTGTQVGSSTSSANGTYSLSISGNATNVRVEFSTPSGYQPSMLGTDNKSSIQFVAVGATDVSYGLVKPGEYCANMFAAGLQGDQLGSTCFQPSNTQSLPTVHVTSWGTRRGTTGVGSASQTGSVWGLGYDGVRGLLWTSAAVRRHSPMGPKKLCGIYATNPTTGTVVLGFDLKADFGLNCGDDTNFGSNQAVTRDLIDSSEQGFDIPAYPLVGAAAFGDLDISPDGQYLFVTNLHDQKIYRFTLGGSTSAPTLAAAGSWAVHNLCSTSGSITRPWALEPISGTEVYVGSVCSNEAATVSNSVAPESGVIQKMTITSNSTATWTTTTAIDLSYVRACSNTSCSNAQKGPLSKWKAWTNDFASINTINASSNLVYPQPIIGDIDLMDDGSMVVGLIDRFSMQMGFSNLQPDPTKTEMNRRTVFVHGDILLFCKTGNSFVQESDGSCTGDSGTKGSHSWDGAFENATSPNREFFNDNYYDGEGIHPELSQGGIAVKPGSGEIAFTAMDPDDWINQGGIRFLKQSDGNRATWPYATVITDNGIAEAAGLNGNGGNLSFMKSASMGDLEVLCSYAPIQIGDRVWYDSNANGIQDPGEHGIAGVVVKLKRSSDNLIWGTAKTDADGHFSFSSNLVDPWNDTSDSTGGGLRANEDFYLEISDAYVGNNFGTNGALVGYQLTTSTQLSSTSPNDTAIDSNAVATSSTVWRVQVPSLAPGNNNFTYDFGVTGVVSVGDKVFIDANANGIQDNGELGLAGAILTLTDMSGAPVTNALGQVVQPVTTTSSGAYLFENLPVAQYKVNITYPEGWGPTLTGQGTASNDSSSFVATSTAFTAPQQSDTTLDFGVVPAVSVGDYVWYDANHDGIQDITDIPLSGVTLTITKADGTPAYNTSGELVTTAVTNSSGKYSFDYLPFGQYKVTVTAPSGYEPTITTTGSSSTDSSTGSATSVVLNTNGQRDPSLDFGFWGEVSVGDYVWFDANADGVQDATDVPLAGVLMTITKADGSPAYDSSGKVVTTTLTDSNGRYTFDHLQFGQYKVTVTAPLAYTSTKTSKGTTATDSSATSATSVLLTANGQSDPTLDFGFVLKSREAALKVLPNVSVGDTVWRDLNGDGRKSKIDPGLRGALITLVALDGTQVVDVTGKVVRPQITNSKGKYLFDGLPPGVAYKVKITYPSGWRPTTANQPGRAINSSSFKAVSLVLRAGQSDLSLDFGVVTIPSMNILPATR